MSDAIIKIMSNVYNYSYSIYLVACDQLYNIDYIRTIPLVFTIYAGII